MTLKKSLASIIFIALVIPAGVQAEGVGDYIIGDSNTVVTRGDFIRAAVKAFDMQTSTSRRKLPYLRTPKAMRPYIEVAHDTGALEVFGNDLQLARGITRGQALVVVIKLKSLTSSEKARYQDVRRNSIEEKAVSVAIKLGWMKPASSTHFGVRRLLKASEGRLLLRRVMGEVVPEYEVPDRFEKIRKSTFAPTKKKKKITTSDDDVPKIRISLTGVSSGPVFSSNLPKAQILETIWEYIKQNFVYDDKINEEEAGYKAAEAIVQSLGDPYSTFLRPAGISNLETQIRGTVSGIGAQVEMRNEVLTIVTPLRSSPAEAAGLKPNDEILKANGEDLSKYGFMDQVNKVRGPKGSIVTLTIRRNGNIFDVKVKRDVIKVPEIEITWQDQIAVVKLLQFGKTTERELRDALSDVQNQNPKGLILDLRNNPGGLLHAANIVLSNFLPSGTEVARIVSREGNRTDKTVVSATIKNNVPIVVIVNEGSASASEIVAGALQDHDRATVVGTKTFGKGTVQQVVRFSDESGLKITIAEWRTPKGRKIDGEGITPDTIVTYSSERDEQMLKALELLR